MRCIGNSKIYELRRAKMKDMVRLRVNLNKVALIRNARGGSIPNLIQFAQDCENYGAQGITVHPRPDERHVRFADLPALKDVVQTEFNVEGYPSERFMKEVLAVRPHQVTLVPDDPSALTSDHGWDMVRHKVLLTEVVSALQQEGIRVSLFADPTLEAMEGAAEIGTDRIEFYTGPYAAMYSADRDRALKPYLEAAHRAVALDLGINAGHDLTLDNLRFLFLHLPGLQEVSIGHQLICDSLYYGISSTIKMYLHRLSSYDH